MGHQDHCPVTSFLLQSTEDDTLVETVQVAGGLIQQQQGRIMEKGTGQADALPFAAG